MQKTKLIDKHNRNINYLRISIIDRCNLQCKYCVPLTPLTILPHKEILTYEEILRIVTVGVLHGIIKVRITGGEPLIRAGVYDFLTELVKIKGLKDVSLTTNGVLLEQNIGKIKAAGIKRINISLDSLDEKIFREITVHDSFNRVWKGIHSALEKGFHPVKINIVALKNINDNEFLNFAKLSIDHPFHIRFIEHMSIGESNVKTDQQLLTPDIKKIVGTLGELIPIENQENDGPAFRYKFKDAKGEVGFISPLSNHFCGKCNRLRLTANGMLRSCLLSDHQSDIKTHLRAGCKDEKISEIFLETIKLKQQKHKLGSKTNQKIHSQMSSIGG